MINLITDCRKFATLMIAFVVTPSFLNLPILNSQDEPNWGDQPVVLQGSDEQPIQTIIPASVPAATEKTYSVFEPPTAVDPQTADQTIQKPVPEGYLPNPADDVVLPQETENVDDPNLDVLMRGPLHEAFAAVYQHDARPSPLVKREPPAVIEELPPEYKPEGDNVQWIPGYWAWDEDRVDFIWISGIWRDVPPGQRWIPGYWQETDDGYRWVTGFWTSEEQQELNYMPQPPESIDNGPSYAAPSDEHFYVPGNWVYQNTNYIWQSGYWAPRWENRIWIPACYVWTPNGCLYRAGYWDYELQRRGVVFAPVCFRAPVYRRISYRYTPSCVINTNYNFLVHLFVRPSCNQYYFGDWYGSRYASRNFYSWSSYHGTSHLRRAYDPLYAYYSCRTTRYNNVQLVSWVQNQHQYYHRHQASRPRHTLQAQIDFTRRLDHRDTHIDAIRRASYGENYGAHVRKHNSKNESTRNRYHRIQNVERLTYVKATNSNREISRQRQTLAQNNRGKNEKANKLVIRNSERSSTRQTEQVRQQIRDNDRTSNRQGGGRQLDRKLGQDNRTPARVAKTEPQRMIDEINRGRQRDKKVAKTQNRESTKTLAQRVEEKRKLDLQRLENERRQQQVRRANERAQADLASKQKAQERDARKKVEERIGSEKLQQEKLAERKRQLARDAEKVAESQKQQSTKTLAQRVEEKRKIDMQRMENERRRQQVRREKERSQEILARKQKAQEKDARTEVEAQIASDKRQQERIATQREQQKRLNEKQLVQPREVQQRNSKRAATLEAQKQAQRRREVQQQTAQRQMQESAQQQRDAQRRAELQKAQRDAQQRAQQEALKRAQRQRAIQQPAKQQTTRQSAQQQNQGQRLAKQQQVQRDAQRRAQLDAQRKTQQLEAQKRVQQQRDVQRRAELQNAQRDAQQRAQRDAQLKTQQREAQKQAQRQRDAQQRAAQQQAAKQRAAQQRAAQQKAAQQRAAQQKAAQQRAAQQRAAQQRAAQQRAAQQRAAQQRAAQQRAAQREAQRRQSQRSKKKGK